MSFEVVIGFVVVFVVAVLYDISRVSTPRIAVKSEPRTGDQVAG